ncbi:hypothetical protein MKW98_008689 [Papaver atlanticum]|uniref:DUF4283 domain-containing protein n=1 Tax=Papaver atlanticum TaxID=357466 RepID=A0AAD4X7T6_9MAGN|nr:hypothetical protein MKW98_008689 [Papaver atlanticum]
MSINSTKFILGPHPSTLSKNPPPSIVEGKHCILARLFTTASHSLQDVNKALQFLWGNKNKFIISCICLNHFKISFEKHESKSWVTMINFWFIYGDVLNVTTWYPSIPIPCRDLRYISSWFSIHGLLPNMHNETVVSQIASKVGMILCKRPENCIPLKDGTVRIKAIINVERPLVKQVIVSVGGSPRTSINFGFDNLPHKFCIFCFRFAHRIDICPILHNGELADIYDSRLESPVSEEESDSLYNGRVEPSLVAEFFSSLSERNTVLVSSTEVSPNLVLDGDPFMSCSSASSFFDAPASSSVLGKRSSDLGDISSPSFSPLKKQCCELGESSSSKVRSDGLAFREGLFPKLDLTRFSTRTANPKASFRIAIDELDSDCSSANSNSPSFVSASLDQYGSNLKDDEEQLSENVAIEPSSAPLKNQSTQEMDSMGGKTDGVQGALFG